MKIDAEKLGYKFVPQDEDCTDVPVPAIRITECGGSTYSPKGAVFCAANVLTDEDLDFPHTRGYGRTREEAIFHLGFNCGVKQIKGSLQRTIGNFARNFLDIRTPL